MPKVNKAMSYRLASTAWLFVALQYGYCRNTKEHNHHTLQKLPNHCYFGDRTALDGKFCFRKKITAVILKRAAKSTAKSMKINAKSVKSRRRKKLKRVGVRTSNKVLTLTTSNVLLPASTTPRLTKTASVALLDWPRKTTGACRRAKFGIWLLASRCRQMSLFTW